MVDFKQFNPTSKKEWIEKLVIDLKGKDINETLHYTDYEEIAYRAYYHNEDLEELNFLNDTFIQGDYLKGKAAYIGVHLDKSRSNADVLSALTQGANHLCLEYSELLDKQLQGVNLAYIALTLKDVPSDEIFEELSKKYKSAGHLIIEKKEEVTSISNDSSLVINGVKIYEQGGNTLDQLTYIGVSLDEFLTQSKNKITEDVIKRISIRFGLGRNFYFNITGVRALRKLVSNILKAHGASDDNAYIFTQLESTSRELCVNDHNSNLLRLSNMGLSGMLAGGDSLVLGNFEINSPSSNGDRLAINLQHLLKEESQLPVFNDYAAGSYFFESLTEDLLTTAWEQICRVSELSNYQEKLATISSSIIAHRNKLNAAYESGVLTLIGANKFPNTLETPTVIKEVELTETPVEYRIEQILTHE